MSNLPLGLSAAAAVVVVALVSVTPFVPSVATIKGHAVRTIVLKASWVGLSRKTSV